MSQNILNVAWRCSCDLNPLFSILYERIHTDVTNASAPQSGYCTWEQDSAQHQAWWEEELILAWLDHRAHPGGQNPCILLPQVDSSHGGYVVDVIVLSVEGGGEHTQSDFLTHSTGMWVRYLMGTLLVRSWTVLECKFDRMRWFLSERLF